MTVAFVLSGGANLGALQVGMLRALMEREVEPDFLVGTSVGALNAGYIAGRGLRPDVVDDLGEIWRGLHTWQLFPPSPRRIVSVLRGHQAALFGDQGLRLLTKRHLTLERIEDALIPLTVVATDLLTGNEVDIRSGPAADAIIASSAIPGLLPAVEWDGRLLIDGGIADNTAISNAVEAGADTIYVLPSGYPCALVEPPTSITGTLLHTMTLLIHKRLVRDIREYTGAAELIVLPPPCPLEVGPLDFSRADELIDRGYEASAAFLKTDGGRRRAPADHIDLHQH
ncbi:patatin-like phospholipase family protein [Gordonia sp. (in: high G+C Gram-positive bacteria)]|uniref:patatin-like phospholipase family protein n=1 Tax=Gordonia sp. (in: high G+C Gram-positive bacteria) TaxID=84139 RepID=UPI0016AF5168|nr:patatin-like phospholipase family protein [Gordonia sp. (in: high G+C Gram-positive bacteria)]NLG45359.1 patatin-like phospholipase family protein [Gordonia sp. (in: high G+C Gram-positive bacteria)]